jgi:hypothetical protein
MYEQQYGFPGGKEPLYLILNILPS